MTVAVDVATRSLGGVKDFLSEWEDTYSNGAYTLALQVAREATEAFPQAPEFWFLRAQTALAAHDRIGAAAHLGKAKECLARNAVGLPASRAQALAECLPLLLDRVRDRTVTGGPRDPWGWLDDPAALRRSNPTFADRMKRPIGRHQPLMPLKPAPRGATSTDDVVAGALRGQLAPIELRRDSLEGLLGRDHGIRIQVDRQSLVDPGLKIERGNIRILDGSVVLAKPQVANATVHVAAAPQRTAPPPAPPARIAPAPPPAPTLAPALAKAATVVGTAAAVLPAAQTALREGAAALGRPAAGAPANAAADKWREWEERIAALVDSGRASEALREVDEAVAKFPQSSRLAEVRADVLRTAGRAEEAAQQWIVAYRKARQSGANERAERALAEARELAKENGDLLMDLAGVAAATGAAATAGAVGKLAADLFRRRGDRKRLHAALRQVVEWLPQDREARGEMERVEREAAAALGLAPAPRAAASEGYAPVAPPRHAAATQPPGGRPLSEAERRVRAQTMPPKGEEAKPKEGDPGFLLLFVSIVLLIFGIGGTPIPGVIGYMVMHAYVQNAAKKSPESSHMTAKFARLLCIVASVIGFARCS